MVGVGRGEREGAESGLQDGMTGRQILGPEVKTTLTRKPPAWSGLFVSGRIGVRAMCPDSIDLWVCCPSTITNVPPGQGLNLLTMPFLIYKVGINKQKTSRNE